MPSPFDNTQSAAVPRVPPNPAPPDTSNAPAGSLTATDVGDAARVSSGTVYPDGPLPDVAGYELLERLGAGGMGMVYKAKQVKLRRLVALKMILGGASASPHQLERFRVEAEAAARLHHPNIIEIYEVGDHHGHPFLSLEYANCGSLAKRLGGKAQSPREAAELMVTLASAVHAAHLAGVLHRDLKPANILLHVSEAKRPADDRNLGHVESRRQGENVDTSLNLQTVIPKIADFGLAKQVDKDDGLSQTGDVMGTPSYMAPEQALGQLDEVGPGTDVYALGVILYEILVGKPPFKGPSKLETLDQVRHKDPVPPRRLQSRIPRDLETICLMCLRKQPAARYATAQDLADDLRRFLAGEPIKARPVGPWERSVKWARRRPGRAAIVGGAIALVLFCTAFAAWYWDRYERVKIEFYSHLARRWGVPEGVAAIPEDTVRHRQYSFKVYRRGGRVEQIDIVNGFGELTTDATIRASLAETQKLDRSHSPCRFRYLRNEGGELAREIAYNRSGAVVWIMSFTGKDTAHYTDEFGFPAVRAGSGAAYVRFLWSPEGFDQEIRYLDVNGRPRPDKQGIFGLRWENNEYGQHVSETCLGPSGQPSVHRNGYSSFVSTLDHQGNIVEQRYFDRAGKPTIHKDGYSIGKQGFDEHGNRIEMSYFNRAGNPTIHKNGYAQITYRFDLHGNQVETNHRDREGKRTLNNNGISTVKTDYDELGNEIRYSYYGINGRPTLNVDGYAGWTVAYDKHGNETEAAAFGTDGKPVLNKRLYSKSIWTYDERGHKIEGATYDEQGRLTIDHNGYAMWKSTLDHRGKLVEQTVFGTQGEPVLDNNGVATKKLTYDERGNNVGTAYYGADGKPTLYKDGHFKLVSKYDEHGSMIEHTFLGLDEKPTMHKRYGYAIAKDVHDERGYWIEGAKFGPDGMPVLHLTSSVHKIVLRYDDRGNCIAQHFFGPDGKPSFHKQGFNSSLKAQYDDRSNLTEMTFFGPDGKPALHKSGNHGFTARYDDRGNRLEQAYFGADGKPVALKDGYAKIVWAYDQWNNKIEESYFGVDGQPILKSGAAKIVWTHDHCGRETSQSFFGTRNEPIVNGNGVHKQTTKRDNRGFAREVAYFGRVEQPVVHRVSGVARFTGKYDARGNRIEEAYFGVNGAPALHSDGYARLTARFDERNRKVEEAYFGLTGESVLNKASFARVSTAYDARGNTIGKLYYGPDGKALLQSDGVAGFRAVYDLADHEIELTYLGANGEPRRQSRGFAKLTRNYSDRNRRVTLKYFDEQGRPTLSSQGIAGFTTVSDDLGRKLLEEYYGLDGTLIINQLSGYARVSKAFDIQGNETECAYFGADGTPMSHPKSGWARAAYAYNDRNQRIARTYYDEKNEQIPPRITITKVAPGGQGERLGLMPEDILLSYDGKRVASPKQFFADRALEKAGQPSRELRVRRGSTVLDFRIAPGPLGVTLSQSP